MRYLVTGGSGKLGLHLCAKLECVAPSHAAFDILDKTALVRSFERYDVNAIIHLAAISDQKLADSRRDLAYAVNVIGTRNIADAANRHTIPLFYISTDYVFPGISGGYRETDPPAPANFYGWTKYAGELEVRASGCEHLVIRTSFRPDAWGFPTAYTNVMTSAELARCVTHCHVRGILHVGTPTKSFYDLARRRHAAIEPEECSDPCFPKRRDLNIDRWLAIRGTTPGT